MDLAKRTRSLTKSETQEINDIAKRMIRNGEDVIDLGAGDPRFSEPDVVTDAGINAINSVFTGYTEAGGIPKLRSAVGQRYKKIFGVDLGAREVLITAGAKAGLFELIQLVVETDDEVIVPCPYYPSYVSQVRLAGGKPIPVWGARENNYLPTRSDIESRINSKTKLIIINSPGNPTGGVYDRSQGREIVELADSRGVFLVSDECYDGFTYRKDMFWTFASAEYGKGFTVGSSSKSFAMTGWRLGYVIGSRRYIDKLEKIQSHFTSSPSAISQRAALAAFRHEISLPSNLLREFKRKRDYLAEGLNKVSGVDCRTPPGSFYLFPNVKDLLIKAGLDKSEDKELARILLDQGSVVTVPGSAFGAPGFLRMAYLPSLTRLEEAVRRINSTFQEI